MLRVGLTGNIGSGKSTVARTWRRLGARVVSADELARRVVVPGSPALGRIAETFGDGVLRKDGSLDRAALRSIVFRDAAARRRLEAIVHPEVERLRRIEEERLRSEGAGIVVHEIPLLFEAGLEGRVDVVVLVDASEEARLRRLIDSRGIDPAEAQDMIGAQMPAQAKRTRADVVIDNNGDVAELEMEAERVWTELERRADASA